MKLPVYNKEGEIVEEIEFPEKIANLEFNENLVHQAARWQMMNSYFPYAHTKTRGEVRGGGRKPWPQKHTGRARHGSIRSPLWKGGGVTFGPRKEKKRTLKINKKMRRKAILMVLAEKLRNNYLKVFDNFDFVNGKTKEIAKVLEKFLKERKTKKKRETALLVLENNKKEVIKGIRNLPYAFAIEARNLNILSLLNHKYVFLEKGAIEKIKETFKI
jgi:large subunit ribosomal protein L4